MKIYQSLIAVLLIHASPVVNGFSPSTMASRSTQAQQQHERRPSSPLHSSLIAEEPNDESTYRYLLAKAREYAYSDDDTTEPHSSAQAKKFLVQILELESGCVSGNLAGHDICDNIADVADIVAHLRRKIETSSNTTVVTAADISASASVGALISFSMVFAGLAELQWQDDITPFTFQEVVWAIKGGYFFPTMVDHFFRNGGL